MSEDDGAGHAGSPDPMARGEEIAPVYIINTCFGLADVVPPERPQQAAGAGPGGDRLSVRAINVLKILADEITGEIPPREDWVPPESLLRKITVERLSIGRRNHPLGGSARREVPARVSRRQIAVRNLARPRGAVRRG